MGLLFWRKNKNPTEEKPKTGEDHKDTESSSLYNGAAMEVPRPQDAAVFEFGTISASSEKVTLAGYCPVSDDIEPCRWQILSTGDPKAPKFRVVF
ncbi:hypothetical protein SUGI_1062940 [Cryptomeria japonica]|uniref:uncharacterized protein LOC131049288 n=1 Tax=Cryptomeria japonica TaxID=3369 RepID=UPI0024146D0F|nr:uncharacterized protein LOC131049288 [Cryptomeria japonica]GLJ49977.1 hypothetical protein SUGI_1062940 [Cryptomeria japonica]